MIMKKIVLLLAAVVSIPFGLLISIGSCVLEELSEIPEFLRDVWEFSKEE